MQSFCAWLRPASTRKATLAIPMSSLRISGVETVGCWKKCIVMCATRLVTNAAVSIIIIIIIIIIFILIYHTGINEVSNRYHKYH